MTAYRLPADTDLGIPSPGAHGGDGVAVARALGIDPRDVVDLSMSLNPFAPDVAALAANHLDSLVRYPDRRDATRLLAGAMGVDASRLVLTNGGSEAIALVAGSIGGTVASEPEFSLHPRSGGGPIWRSNPHSPSGDLAGPGEHADVWDEAFYAMATGAWTRRDTGAVVVGSLTKLFACPGLRLGYVLADEAQRLTADQPGWPINGLALALLPALLEQVDLPGWRDAIAERRRELAELLTDCGLEVEAADAPWVLVASRGLRARLAPHGIVVRDCSSFGMPDHVRIAVPDEQGLERLDAALRRSLMGADEARAATVPGEGTDHELHGTPGDGERHGSARRHPARRRGGVPREDGAPTGSERTGGANGRSGQDEDRHR